MILGKLQIFWSSDCLYKVKKVDKVTEIPSSGIL